jgi:acid stress-induced BolA-like protein IbaG/YrbA
MGFGEKLESVLRGGRFAPCQVILEPTATGRYGGFLVSEAFRGIEQVDRQTLLWMELAEHFDQGELQDIISILTLTPEELREAS